MKCTAYVQCVKLRKNDLSLQAYLAVGVGGMIGSVLRYLMSVTVQTTLFSFATFFVNMSGAFLLTFILFLPYFKSKLAPIVFTALTTGLIGSYTTFSAITTEVVIIWQKDIVIAIIYLSVTVIGGLLCSFAGYKTASTMKRKGW